MAHYQEVDYCSEEVKSVANPAGGGVQQHVVKEKFQEVDKVPRFGRGHGHGHLELRDTKLEEDVNTCTGEFHERKESTVYRAD